MLSKIYGFLLVFLLGFGVAHGYANQAQGVIFYYDPVLKKHTRIATNNTNILVPQASSASTSRQTPIQREEPEPAIQPKVIPPSPEMKTANASYASNFSDNNNVTVEQPRITSYQMRTPEPKPKTRRERMREIELIYEQHDHQAEEDWLSIELSASSGFRKDELDWNIASDTSGAATPNILSELKWTDLKMNVIQGEAEVAFNNKYVLDGSVAYGDIYDGDNQDSDYLGNNRTIEFSRSNNNGSGDVLDLTAGVGYRFMIPGPSDLLAVDNIGLTLMAGYGHNEQNLRMTDGFQTLDPFNIIGFTGPFDNLNSSYDAEWQGPWIGFNLTGERKKLAGKFRLEYHWADYEAKANWNLRSDFQHPVSFIHEGDGRGIVLKSKFGYKITRFISLDFLANYQHWSLDDGLDRTFLAAGGTADTRLNEVNWSSYTLALGATANF